MRIPIITIGGFLGAGKTTLVNELLEQQHGQRIVVFVNDFGEINIDHELIATVEEDKVSLKNGCVCCTLNEDLIGQVMDYVNGDDRPDGFVIEASGVADPMALDASINALEEAGCVIADMRLYIVDAENFHLLSYDDAETVIDNAAASDLIIINKIDCAPIIERQNLSATLKVAAPYSLCIETSYCDIGLPIHSLPVNGFQNRLSHRVTPEGKNKKTVEPLFSQWSVACDNSIDRAKFDTFVSALPSLCWRAKGILKFCDDSNSSYVFHFVGQRASLEKLPISKKTEQSQFVAISKTTTFRPQVIEAKFFESLA